MNTSELVLLKHKLANNNYSTSAIQFNADAIVLVAPVTRRWSFEFKNYDHTKKRQYRSAPTIPTPSIQSYMNGNPKRINVHM